MKILYICPSPPPPVPDTDGLFNEIGYLQKSTGGDVLYLSPFRLIPSFIPIRTLGLQNIPKIRNYEKQVDLIHIFFPYIVNFYFLRFLRKPTVYTIASGIGNTYKNRSFPYSGTIVVSSDYELTCLRNNGLNNVTVIRPGVDLSRIKEFPDPEDSKEFVIFAGSSPWTRDQLQSKGFTLFLEVLAHIPDTRLVCLWRGGLYEEWQDLILESGLADRIETINEKADISRVLSRCHAAVVLAASANLIKSYPNSLMEALAAGKPVLISRVIPMSHYVEKNGCGIVIEHLTTDDLISAIKEVKNHYSTFKSAADRVGRRDFSCERMVGEYCTLYDDLIDLKGKKSNYH